MRAYIRQKLSTLLPLPLFASLPTMRDSDGPTPTYSQHPSRMTETTIIFCYWNFVSISSREREREDVLDLVSSTPMSHSVWIHATNS
ncbi:hypothetical protein AB3S75_045128 [Citrus x aurantiifolia]